MRLYLFAALFLWSTQLTALEEAKKPGPGILLVAKENMVDPRFRQSVVMLVEYSRVGAWGLIINRPSDVSVGQIVPDLEVDSTVYFGGPVQLDRLVLVLERDDKAAGHQVLPGLTIAEDLEMITEHLETGAKVRVYAGYAGWGPGQLDFELAAGGWLLTPGRADDVFDGDPVTLWQRLIDGLSALEI